jgi:hypothetical protein
MKGKISAIYPEGPSSVYRYICQGEGGLFSFAVEWRYHRDILESEGEIIGRMIEYDNDSDPPIMSFLD